MIVAANAVYLVCIFVDENSIYALHQYSFQVF